ncbi:MAG: type 1 glutamine amidotransferase domain-containing protein [Selenomonadaceae bacterium]|nr:type 1 glutamine amidotransferase domain-containing protein [Selenomonadaceae bacterium]
MFKEVNDVNRFFKIVLAVLLLIPMIFASHSEAAKNKGKIIVVASCQDKLVLANGTTMNVGFFLNEFAVPAQYLAEKGYEIVLATPDGGVPVMDKSSNDKMFFNGDDKARAKAESFVKKLKPKSFKSIINDGLDKYAGIFVPGGHAPMVDLMQDEELGAMLRYFHDAGKPTAFICHGPIAALAALPNAKDYRKALVERDPQGATEAAKDWIYSGYRMTIFSDAEEWSGEVAMGTEMPFHVEQALQIAGGIMVEGNLFQCNVIRDRELITGQNPASDLELAKEMEKALSE